MTKNKRVELLVLQQCISNIKTHLKLLSLSQIYTSTCGDAYFGSVTPKAAFEKCAAYFSKEAKLAPKQVRSPAGCGGESNNFKRTN